MSIITVPYECYKGAYNGAIREASKSIIRMPYECYSCDIRVLSSATRDQYEHYKNEHQGGIKVS